MGFDLYFLPTDGPLTVAEAGDAISRDQGFVRRRLGHDRRLDPFLADVEQRWPGVRQARNDALDAEFNVGRSHVFVGLGWDDVARWVPLLAEVAWRNGLAVYDPQREVVGLPSPLATAPLADDGLDDHVRSAQQVLGAVVRGVMLGGDDAHRVQRAVAEQVRSVGGKTMSPLGFEITPDVEDEAFADPLRVPTSLQTAERKADLLAGLASGLVDERHGALRMLAGWDQDAEVDGALRRVLASDDTFEVGSAAAALARRGDVTDLPGVLEAVHRLSPADGGTSEAMILPLHAALDLAALAGPEIVAGVKVRAREWRGTPRARRHAWEAPAEEELDQLLAE
jgi:hypothetical protein